MVCHICHQAHVVQVSTNVGYIDIEALLASGATGTK